MKKRVIVIGAGGAGLTAAVAAAKEGAEVILLAKTGPGNASCTAYSGGFFSLASGSVSPEDHLRQVLETGREVSDGNLLRTLAFECEGALRTLHSWGVAIQINNSGRGSVRKSAPSEIMGGAGMTGELTRIAKAEGVSILPDCAATRLLIGEKGVEGAEWVEWKTGKARSCSASAVILATGGGGRIYTRTDNPARMTGDGYSLALESGLGLVDMEYVQFYPLGWKTQGYPVWMVGLTILDYIPVTDGAGREFLKEAILSWGFSSGKEANYFGRDKTAIFLSRHEKNGEKAFLHIEKLSEEMLSNPDVRSSIMLDIPAHRRTAPVEVSPVQHYFSGGIPIDGEGRTDLPGLYACGEVTGGVDGASRMGGNALTNIVTFGLRAGRAAAAEAVPCGGEMSQIAMPPLYFPVREGGTSPSEARERLRAICSKGLGPCRNAGELRSCIEEIGEWKSGTGPLAVKTPLDLLHALEMKGLAVTAQAVAAGALTREESRGVHFREDFPEECPGWKKRIRISLEKDTFSAVREDIHS